MNKQRSTEIKVGIVSFVGILIFILGISWGRGYNVSVNQKAISLHFPSSSGIEIASPVTINGVKRGLVSSVKNDTNGVIVTATIDDISDLKQDAGARITMLEITGGKKIEIKPGQSSEKFNPATTIIVGSTDMDITELVAVAGSIAADARILVRRLDTIANSATTLLADGTFVDNAKSSVNNLNSLLENTNDLVSRNKSKIQTTIDNLNVIVADVRQAVKTNSPKIESLLTKLDATIDNANKTLASADGAVKNADSTLTQVNGLITDIKTGKGLVSKIMYDRNFANRLDSSMTLLHDLAEKILEHGINVNVRLGTRP